MSKVVKEEGVNVYESLKAAYFSGLVKPALKKILAELQSDPENHDLILLACQCLARTKDFDRLSDHADLAIKLNPENAGGYYYKGVALHNTKGKEQEVLKSYTEALAIEPENVLYLKEKATTHLILYTDYHLPLKFADKHRAKGEEILIKIIELVENMEAPSYLDYFIVGDVSVTIKKNMDAKKYYLRAVNAYEKEPESNQDKNIYKELIKAQKACIKLSAKFTE